MRTFKNLKEGTIVHNDTDGNMIVIYSDLFSENGEKELCFQTEKSIWRGTEFDPKDWEIK